MKRGNTKMDHIRISEELLDFAGKSPSAFHAVANIAGYLEARGFRYLPETAKWDVAKGGSYYTTRNGSSIIAFRIGQDASSCSNGGDAAGSGSGFRICASHSDSPTYKIKNVPELEGPGEYLRLNVEAYGGMIDSTWLDRPLSVAGRVLVREKAEGTERWEHSAATGGTAEQCGRSSSGGTAGSVIRSRLLDIDRDILLIPNVAIHMSRDINSGYKFNRQVDLCPLFSAGALKKGAFDRLIADELGVEPENILGKDLFLVNRQKPVLWGVEKEFISAPGLDDLQCAFSSLRAFTDSSCERSVNVYCCFDNEEVGSNTKQGAMSTFLYDTLQRINSGLGRSEEDYRMAVARSFMVSCDNAHAVHPNHPEKTDAENRVFLNKGVVIKESANQKYTTDAFSRAVFGEICREAAVPVQHFANRSDSAGGSTLGNLSNIQVSMHAVDIGLPQLAMHSSYETAGSMDTKYAVDALMRFYSTDIEITDGGAVI